jgi:hypothetical protein
VIFGDWSDDQLPVPTLPIGPPAGSALFFERLLLFDFLPESARLLVSMFGVCQPD